LITLLDCAEVARTAEVAEGLIVLFALILDRYLHFGDVDVQFQASQEFRPSAEHYFLILKNGANDPTEQYLGATGFPMGGKPERAAETFFDHPVKLLSLGSECLMQSASGGSSWSESIIF